MQEVLWLAFWKTMWSTPKSDNDLKIAWGLFHKLDILGYHPFTIPDAVCPDLSTYSYNDGIPSNWGMKIFSVPNNRTADKPYSWVTTWWQLFFNLIHLVNCKSLVNVSFIILNTVESIEDRPNPFVFTYALKLIDPLFKYTWPEYI